MSAAPPNCSAALLNRAQRLRTATPYSPSFPAALFAIKTSSACKYFARALDILQTWAQHEHVAYIVDSMEPAHNVDLRRLVGDDRVLVAANKGWHFGVQRAKTVAALRYFQAHAGPGHAWLCYLDDDMHVNTRRLARELELTRCEACIVAGTVSFPEPNSSPRARRQLDTVVANGAPRAWAEGGNSSWPQGGWCATRRAVNVLLQALAQRKTYSGADDVGFAAFAQRLGISIRDSVRWINQYTRSTISLRSSRTKVTFYDKEYPSRAQSRGFSLQEAARCSVTSPYSGNNIDLARLWAWRCSSRSCH